MKTTNIYILIDPETQQVRYVGKANNISQRYKAHLNRARKHQIHKLNWISSLKNKGLKPIIEVVDIVLIEEWIFWENYWISQFKTWGFNLINYTNGGEGSTFGNQTSFKKGQVPWNTGKGNTCLCEECGRSFKASISSKRRFCSRICTSLYNSKNLNSGTFKQGVEVWNRNKSGYTTSKKGQTISQEIRDKISASLKGRESGKKRITNQYDKNMNFIKEHQSVTQAVIDTGIKGINNALTGRAKTAGGYIWL